MLVMMSRTEKTMYEFTVFLNNKLLKTYILLKVETGDRVDKEYEHIHDEHTSPRHKFLFGNMRYLDMDRIVNIDEGI